MTTKTDNPKKPISKMEKAKMSKTTKGLQKLTKADKKQMKATKIRAPENAHKSEEESSRVTVNEPVITISSLGDSSYKTVLEIPVRPLLGGSEKPLGEYGIGRPKVYLCVNVASK